MKHENLRLNYKVWIETLDGTGVLGDGKWQLLKAIEETGSLKSAMEKLNLTYRKTWNNLQQMEERLGFSVIHTIRGGSDGGKTILTEEGKKIVAAFDKFHASFDTMAQRAFEDFWKELSE